MWRFLSLLVVAVLLGCASPMEPDCGLASTAMVDARGDTVSVVQTEFCLKIVGAVP